MRDTERERQRHRQREKQAPHWEPDMGLYPGSPRSGPGLKSSTKLLSHQGCPRLKISIKACPVLLLIFTRSYEEIYVTAFYIN